MRPDEILDLSSSKNLSHFQEQHKKNKRLFNVFLGLTILCIVCILGIIFKVPQSDLNDVPYFPALLLLGFVGSAAMFFATFFKFLATHHERNIATYHETTYPFANNIFMARVHLFVSTIIFALTISLTGDNLNAYTRTFERGTPREWAFSFFIVIISAICIFFYQVGLRGLYQWSLYLDHKIRIANNYETRINIILPRFLILLGVGLVLIFDAFLNDFLIIRFFDKIIRIFGHNFRNLTVSIVVSLFINYLLYSAFSLFLWIHTIISYKNQDAGNIET